MNLKLKKKFSKGFTLVELVIVIAIIIVLSVASVPIYRSYVDKAKRSEGYALLGAVLSAQKAYYSEYGYFYVFPDTTRRESIAALGIDARSNRYFSDFRIWSKDGIKISFSVDSIVKGEIRSDKKYDFLNMSYNITTGVYIFEDIRD